MSSSKVSNLLTGTVRAAQTIGANSSRSPIIRRSFVDSLQGKGGENPKPRIFTLPSPADASFRTDPCSETIRLNNYLLKDLLPKDYKDKLSTLEEVAIHARNAIQMADAIIVPGSPFTLSEEYRKPVLISPAANMQDKLKDPAKKNELRNLAYIAAALARGLPIISSCNGAAQVSALLGAKMWTQEEMHKEKEDWDAINHDRNSQHDILLNPESFLAQSRGKKQTFNSHGLVIIRNVPSTHPLLIKEPSYGTKIEAWAPDESPSLMSSHGNNIIILSDSIHRCLLKDPKVAIDQNEMNHTDVYLNAACEFSVCAHKSMVNNGNQYKVSLMDMNHPLINALKLTGLFDGNKVVPDPNDWTFKSISEKLAELEKLDLNTSSLSDTRGR